MKLKIRILVSSSEIVRTLDVKQNVWGTTFVTVQPHERGGLPVEHKLRDSDTLTVDIPLRFDVRNDV